MKHHRILATLALGSVGLSAQAADVTLYGIVDTQFENIRATGATNPAQDKPARWRVSNVSSELGVRASIALGEGMTGMVQYTTGISSDTGNGGTSGGMFGSAKDTFVGLQFEKIGTIKLGRMTAAARWNSGTADFSPMGAGVQDDQGMLSGAGGQSAAGPQFNTRMDNTLAFESARFYGFSGRVYFSANENKSSATVASGSQLDDKSYSLGLQYVTGPLDLRLSHEVRNDKGVLNGSTDHNTRDRDFRFGMRYALTPATTLALGYDNMELKDASAVGTAKTMLKKHGWVVGARHVIDKHTIYGGYGSGSDISCATANGTLCNGADTGARNAVIAYNYNFNKQMMVEVFAARVSNQARGKYDFDSGGISPAAGAASSVIATGFRYAF